MKGLVGLGESRGSYFRKGGEWRPWKGAVLKSGTKFPNSKYKGLQVRKGLLKEQQDPRG